MPTPLIKSLFALAVLFQGALGLCAQSDAIIRTERIDMRPTLIGDTRIQNVTIPVRAFPPGEYTVLTNLRTPFALVADSSDLRTVNGEIIVTVSFAPTVVGLYNEVIELIRQPQVTPVDTIRVLVTGTAFRIERRVFLDYGNVVLGDTAVRAVPIAANLADNEEWEDTKPLKLPYTHLTSNGPIGTGDTLAFLFKFQPARTGEFLDSVGLIRKGSGVNLDTIVVYLRGVGIRQSINLAVQFSPAITGDSVERRRTFRPPPGADRRFTVDHTPGRPFKVLFDGNVQPSPTDSVFVAIAYMPRNGGVHTDSLVLIRRDIEGQPLDTVSIQLNGSAKGLPARDSITFVGVVVGEPQSQNHTVTLPIEPVNEQFSYNMDPSSIGPFTAIVVDPTTPSKTTKLELKITANPDTFGDVEEEVDVVRFDKSGIEVDRTRILVRMSMKPRPARVSLAWAADTVVYSVGDTATLDLVLELEGDPDSPLSVSALDAIIEYNPTIFVPLEQDGQSRVVTGQQVTWQIRSTYGPAIQIVDPSTVLTTVRGVVVLGDATSMPLPILNTITFVGEDPQQIESRPGRLIIDNIWEHAGGQRLVNPFVGNLILEVAPNPVVTSSIIRVENVPEGMGRLVIYTATGEEVSDFTEDLQGGQREWIVSSGSESTTSLTPGSYYIRLVVADSDSGVMNSVVRLFIVQ